MPALLARLRGLPGLGTYEVLVVDNGSRDGSAAAARRAGARVLRCARRGYGAALRRGLAAVRHPWVVCADADDTCDVARVPELLARLAAGADLAVGSRRGYDGPGRGPWLHRRVGTPLLTALLNARHGRPGGPRLSDCTSGLFAFRRGLLKGVTLRSEGFDFNVEFYAQALRRGWAVAEVDVGQRPSHSGRQPHLRPWADGWRLLRRIVAVEAA